MRLLEFLGRLSGSAIVALAALLLVLLALVDYLAGPALDLSVLHLLPVSLVAWYLGRRAGLVMSAVSAAALVVADWLTQESYLHPIYLLWNTFLRFGFFVVVTLALSALRRATDNESRLARTDPLTGAANARAFAELGARELERARRYGQPFTVALLDVDDFKAVNDRLGHHAGDALLRAVADTIRRNLRAVDVVARLGGDEFGLLLPQTGHDPAAFALRKLQKALLETAGKNGWPVSFSIGAVSCVSPTCSMDELLRVADGHMYAVKRGGKNGIRQVVLG
jgi:diguanylate cyclase (GGDEF)-like protein